MNKKYSATLELNGVNKNCLKVMSIDPCNKNKKLFRAKLQLSEDVLDIISNSLNNKLCVSYSSCTVYPVKPHRRCRKCQVHGHTKSQCTQNKPTCAYCAGDHFTDQCPVSDQEDKKKCINCYKSTKYKDVCNHTADSYDCPVFLDYRKDMSNVDC